MMEMELPISFILQWDWQKTYNKFSACAYDPNRSSSEIRSPSTYCLGALIMLFKHLVADHDSVWYATCDLDFSSLNLASLSPWLHRYHYYYYKKHVCFTILSWGSFHKICWLLWPLFWGRDCDRLHHCQIHSRSLLSFPEICHFSHFVLNLILNLLFHSCLVPSPQILLRFWVRISLESLQFLGFTQDWRICRYRTRHEIKSTGLHFQPFPWSFEQKFIEIIIYP